MKTNVCYFAALFVVGLTDCAFGHGFALSLVDDSQNNPVVITPASEATILDPTGNPVGPQNLFISSFSGTPSANGSYGVIHGFAYATGAWPDYAATYNILSPLFFSDGTATGPLAAVTATSGTYVNLFDRDVGLYPGAASGNVQITGGIAGVGPFVRGYGVSLFDPHELQKQLFPAAGSSQIYGEYGFSYEVSVALPGGQTMTTGPLVDVFATDIGDGGFFSNAPISQQNAASLAIYTAAIAVPESWNHNGDGNYSDVANWYQTVPNGLGFTVAFGDCVTTAITAPALSVTIDRAVYAGTLQFNTANRSYTLATDGIPGHGIVLNNNGIGSAVDVTAGNHAIAADVTLADTGGTTFTIALGSALTLGGAVTISATNPTVTLNGSGMLQLTGQQTIAANTAIHVNGGKLKTNAGTSSNIESGVTVTINSAATLELAGSYSALSFAVNVTNNGNQASGGALLVTGTSQQVGSIDGSGDLVISAGGALTASHVSQDALVIGGATSDVGLLTIAPSDSGGSVLVVAGSLAPREPFGAAHLEAAEPFSVGDPSSVPELRLASPESAGLAVPEPPTNWLALIGLAAMGMLRTHRRLDAAATGAARPIA
jgi:hypothetical protein